MYQSRVRRKYGQEFFPLYLPGRKTTETGAFKGTKMRCGRKNGKTPLSRPQIGKKDLFVQLENSKEGLGGHLDSAQGTHLLFAF